MTSGAAAVGGLGRTPTWKERENNKRRERRRRAIAAKIFTGLRALGNYKLPKHCDNNEVLKALCREAGWVVEDDGTTYRKIRSELWLTSPCASCVVFAGMQAAARDDEPVLVLAAAERAVLELPEPGAVLPRQPGVVELPEPDAPRPRQRQQQPHPRPRRRSSRSGGGGLLPAPVPPGPAAAPRLQQRARDAAALVAHGGRRGRPPSPTRARRREEHPDTIPECDESDVCCSAVADSGRWISFQIGAATTAPASPAYNLVNPAGGGGGASASDSMELDGVAGAEFEFDKGRVTPWEGERIHEVAAEELELTLGVGAK
uniref:Protein BZR1 homolog n=1 Tax=Zea mays TaxID=4577 RepID=A0A2D0Z7M7_MAIZE|nr:BES1/BZR family protein BES1/BZR7 [Zea mays]